MDYKQRYMDALEIAKGVYHELRNDRWRDWLTKLFPELKESEDERIRKDIISYLRNEKIVNRYISDIDIDKWIAWLEKQGQMLDPDKVIEWIDEHVPTKFEDMANYVQQFKKDFGL